MCTLVCGSGEPFLTPCCRVGGGKAVLCPPPCHQFGPALQRKEPGSLGLTGEEILLGRSGGRIWKEGFLEKAVGHSKELNGWGWMPENHFFPCMVHGSLNYLSAPISVMQSSLFSLTGAENRPPHRGEKGYWGRDRQTSYCAPNKLQSVCVARGYLSKSAGTLSLKYML